METKLKEVKAVLCFGGSPVNLEIIEPILVNGNTHFLCIGGGDKSRPIVISPKDIKEIVSFKEDLREKAIEDITNTMNNMFGIPAPAGESDNENEDDSNLDWKAAENFLYSMKKDYEEIGAAGVLALNISIRPLVDRFEQGERTKWLYNEINQLQ